MLILLRRLFLLAARQSEQAPSALAPLRRLRICRLALHKISSFIYDFFVQELF